MFCVSSNVKIPLYISVLAERTCIKKSFLKEFGTYILFMLISYLRVNILFLCTCECFAALLNLLLRYCVYTFKWNSPIFCIKTVKSNYMPVSRASVNLCRHWQLGTEVQLWRYKRNKIQYVMILCSFKCTLLI